MNENKPSYSWVAPWSFVSFTDADFFESLTLYDHRTQASSRSYLSDILSHTNALAERLPQA